MQRSSSFTNLSFVSSDTTTSSLFSNPIPSQKPPAISTQDLDSSNTMQPIESRLSALSISSQAPPLINHTPAYLTNNPLLGHLRLAFHRITEEEYHASKKKGKRCTVCLKSDIIVQFDTEEERRHHMRANHPVYVKCGLCPPHKEGLKKESLNHHIKNLHSEVLQRIATDPEYFIPAFRNDDEMFVTQLRKCIQKTQELKK